MMWKYLLCIVLIHYFASINTLAFPKLPNRGEPPQSVPKTDSLKVIGALMCINPLPEKVLEIANGVFQYEINSAVDETVKFYLDFKTKPGSIGLGEFPGDIDVHLSVNDINFVKLFTKKMNGFTAWTLGRLKTAGDITKAIALNDALEVLSRDYEGVDPLKATKYCLDTEAIGMAKTNSSATSAPATTETELEEYDARPENDNRESSNEIERNWINFSSEDDSMEQVTSTVKYTTTTNTIEPTTENTLQETKRSRNFETRASSLSLESSTIPSSENPTSLSPEIKIEPQLTTILLPSPSQEANADATQITSGTPVNTIFKIIRFLVCLPMSPVVNRLAKNGTFQFTITFDNRQDVNFFLDFSTIPAKIDMGNSNKIADVNFSVSEEGFVQLFTHKVDRSATTSVVKGQLKATGNLNMAMEFNKVIKLLSSKYRGNRGLKSTRQCSNNSNSAVDRNASPEESTPYQAATTVSTLSSKAPITQNPRHNNEHQFRPDEMVIQAVKCFNVTRKVIKSGTGLFEYHITKSDGSIKILRMDFEQFPGRIFILDSNLSKTNADVKVYLSLKTFKDLFTGNMSGETANFLRLMTIEGYVWNQFKLKYAIEALIEENGFVDLGKPLLESC